MSRAHDIEQAAALWLVRREEPEWSATDQAALDAWLERSMAHKAAYWRLEHGWREADRIRAVGPVTVPERPHASPARRWRLAAAAAVFGLIGAGSLYLLRAPAPVETAERFQTAVGGHRIVPLADGSRVELNTASVVRASVTDRHRDVWLDRGEAYFEIAHRDGRPFVVHAGSRTVTVLGTKFSVRRDGDRQTVAVIEGRVRIDDAARPGAAAAAIITAGDVAVARGTSMLLAAKSEDRVKAALAWREGMLDFDRTTLADAVAEFNRYNRRQIAIGDAEAGALRIGGSFQASNVDAFVRLLRDAYGLRVTQDRDGIRIAD